MYKPTTAATTAAILGLLLTSSAAMADDILVINESLNALPQGYELQSGSSANATVDFRIGNIGTSNGLILDGSWDVPPSGEEFAFGVAQPILQFPVDFQIDPRNIGGIASVHWTLDTEVISATMDPSIQGIFAQLLVYQEQTDGFIYSFSERVANYVLAGQSVSLDVTLFESDFIPSVPGSSLDFSAAGRPILFALLLSAVYPRDTTPDAFFVDGRMTAKNWTVSVSNDFSFFKDGFEPGSVMPGAAEWEVEVDCPMCASPVILPPLNK